MDKKQAIRAMQFSTLDSQIQDSIIDELNHGYSRGYADGLEAAAKIVDKMSVTGETNTAVALREQAAKVREYDK